MTKVAQLAQADGLLLTTMAYRNRIINGDFDIWQRGVSQATTGYGCADRWFLWFNGAASCTATRQAFAPGQTAVPGNPHYFYRATVTGGSAANESVYLQQNIEGAHTFSGGKARLSFWAKADAPKEIAIDFWQRYALGGGVLPRFGSRQFSLTTEWQRFTAVIDVPSVSAADDQVFAGSLHFVMYFSAGADSDPRTLALGHQSGVFDIAQIQMSEGGADGAFEKRPLGIELGLCQRYYEKTYNQGDVPGTLTLSGALTQRQVAGAGATDSFFWKFAVPKAVSVYGLTKYNPEAANALVRNYTNNTNCTDVVGGVEGALYGNHGAHIPFVTAAGSSAGNLNIVHLACSAEIQ